MSLHQVVDSNEVNFSCLYSTITLYTGFFLFNMETYNLINIFKIFNCELNDPLNSNVIEQLQNSFLIPKEGDYLCPRGHKIRLVARNHVKDTYSWK